MPEEPSGRTGGKGGGGDSFGEAGADLSLALSGQCSRSTLDTDERQHAPRGFARLYDSRQQGSIREGFRGSDGRPSRIATNSARIRNGYSIPCIEQPRLVVRECPGFGVPMSPPPLQESISAEQATKLAAELSELSFQQALALKDAAFTGMTKAQAREFDRRRDRISELCTLLGKVR